MILYKAAMTTRTELSDQMLHYDLVKNSIDTFKSGRKDSKAWSEAADFLVNYFDETNRFEVSLDES